MAELTPLQKNQLIQKESGISAEQIFEYIQKFSNLGLDDFPQMNPEKRKWIQNAINEQPNPSEIEEWENIQSFIIRNNALDASVSDAQNLLDRLTEYLTNWGTIRPKGNHIDEAFNLKGEVQKQIELRKVQIEEADWQKVNPLSVSDLIGHLYKYTDSVHKDEIDDSIWGLTDYEKVQDLNNYNTLFPHGKHHQQASAAFNDIVEWDSVKSSEDIFTIFNYVKSHASSPFKNKADLLLLQLKQVELSNMKNSPNEYTPEKLMRLLDNGIFTDNELFREKVLTPNILSALRNASKVILPDMQKVMDKCSPSCPPECTDVFFWGIPSTGKTCVLMGLSCASRLDVCLASGGGSYAETLMQYTECGKVVPATPGDFVTTMDATIYGKEGVKHKVTLVEMSGEEFAFEIAKNPDAKVSFEHMGTKATNLLNNNNNKVFFVIIDPTATVVPFSHRYINGYDEETGKPMYDFQFASVNQRLVLKKLIDLFAHPDNQNIMKKVNAIHFIITKSDTLDRLGNREEEAYKLFNATYSDLILDKLEGLCEEYNINAATNYRPLLYTFSLGRFYIGNLYEYDSTDSDKLVKAMKNATDGVKKETFWQKIQKTFN